MSGIPLELVPHLAKAKQKKGKKNSHLFIDQCISLYRAMESLSLYISINQCQLLTNKAVPVALHVSIAMVTMFSVCNLH